MTCKNEIKYLCVGVLLTILAITPPFILFHQHLFLWNRNPDIKGVTMVDENIYDTYIDPGYSTAYLTNLNREEWVIIWWVAEYNISVIITEKQNESCILKAEYNQSIGSLGFDYPESHQDLLGIEIRFETATNDTFVHYEIRVYRFEY